MLSSQHGPATPIWKYLTPWSGNPALECFSLCLIPRPWQRRAGPQLLLSFILSSSNIQITLWASSPCACTPVFSPARGLFSSLATTAVPWPRFLFLRQLFPSAGLTGSLLDNRAPSSSLPWPAVSTVWSFLIRSSVLPASQQARCCCPEVGQPRVRGNTPPLHESKTQRKTIYACVDVSTEKSFDYLQAWTRGTHTHTHTEQWGRDGWDFKHCPRSVCWRPSVSSCRAARFFPLCSISADHSWSKHADHSQPHFL